MAEDFAIGQGGGNDAPTGTVPAGVPSSTPAEPSILDIPDDNALVRVKGSEKPIKFGDYSRGFQARATRAEQERGRLERELANERQTRERFEREAASRANQGGQNNQPDVYEQLKALPYLDGETAAKVVQSIGSQFQNRDRILLGMAQEVQRLQQIVGGLNTSHTQSTFDSKIDKYLSEGGYGPELRDLAVETYLAYQPGADLDAEFPQILANRVEQVTKYLEAKRQASLASARKSPFVPGKGGQTGPSRPLELDPRATAKDTADKLWDMMQGGPGT